MESCIHGRMPHPCESQSRFTNQAMTPTSYLEPLSPHFGSVSGDLGAVARPARVRFVSALPKTRSGKLLRRAIQAVCEGRDAGDLTTMDDPAALQQIRDRVAGQ